MRLDEISPDDTATVVSVEDTGVVSRRILEMGITPGVRIAVIKSAPFGDPIEVSVRGYKLAMRRSEAASIVVSI